MAKVNMVLVELESGGRVEAKTPIVQSSLRLQLGSFLVVNPMDTLSECGMGYAWLFCKTELAWQQNEIMD